MRVLLYLLVPAMIVSVAALVMWVRNRQPTSLESGVDAFQREMDALSPDAVQLHRRRAEPPPGSSNAGARPAGPRAPQAPRRPQGPAT